MSLATIASSVITRTSDRANFRNFAHTLIRGGGLISPGPAHPLAPLSLPLEAATSRISRPNPPKTALFRCKNNCEAAQIMWNIAPISSDFVANYL